jgi:hypothetical protein
MKRRLSLAMSLLMAAAVLSPAAQAKERERKTTITGEKGRTATRDVTRNQGDVTQTTTGPNGKSKTRSVDRIASGATATVTGPRGRTLNRQTTRTETGSTTTVTGPDGKTKTVTIDKQKQP